MPTNEPNVNDDLASVKAAAIEIKHALENCIFAMQGTIHSIDHKTPHTKTERDLILGAIRFAQDVLKHFN